MGRVWFTAWKGVAMGKVSGWGVIASILAGVFAALAWYLNWGLDRSFDEILVALAIAILLAFYVGVAIHLTADSEVSLREALIFGMLSGAVYGWIVSPATGSEKLLPSFSAGVVATAAIWLMARIEAE